jgi:Putative Actinobacterial Holin-X, holin superfamily III
VGPGADGADATPAQIAATLSDVSEKAQLLIREEIELAKTEVITKVTKLAKGAVVGLAAGFFAIVALFFILEGLAWLAWYELPFPDQAYFWGFFVLAGVLLLVGGLAGFLAWRLVKGGSPPTPSMAIEEAQLIKETVRS